MVACLTTSGVNCVCHSLTLCQPPPSDSEQDAKFTLAVQFVPHFSELITIYKISFQFLNGTHRWTDTCWSITVFWRNTALYVFSGIVPSVAISVLNRYLIMFYSSSCQLLSCSRNSLLHSPERLFYHLSLSWTCSYLHTCFLRDIIHRLLLKIRAILEELMVDLMLFRVLNNETKGYNTVHTITWLSALIKHLMF
jgi:hypothetical protein